MQVSLSNHSRTQTANLMMSYSRDVGVAPTVGATPTSRLKKTAYGLRLTRCELLYLLIIK